jgi:ABC-type nitrate/sulfonate/bicarbonate transport system permease component
MSPGAALVGDMARPRLAGRTSQGLIGVAMLLLFWEVAARFVWRDPQVLPSPAQCLIAAWNYLTPQELARHVGISLARVLGGFALAALASIVLGGFAAWYTPVARVVRPIVGLLRPIPPLAWIPMAIIWFGLGESSKVFVIFLGAFFPIFTNALRGMGSVSPVLLRAARTMDVDGPELLLRVALPAALPDIVTGLRVGLGLAFGILIAAELIAADSGIGYLIMQSRETGQMGVAIFGVILIGLLSLVCDGALSAVVRRIGGRGALG